MDITKASGEREPYDRDKFCASLKRTGAPEALVSEVCAFVEKNLTPGISTLELFRKASHYLLEAHPQIGIRFNLKKGLMELGPAGFRFEQYIEAILKSLGFETKRDVIVEGECVSHEIDVVAKKGGEHYLLEMKYRNDPGLKTDIETTMYAHARFLDISPVEARGEKEGGTRHAMWLVTNAKFTSKAIQYGECRKLKMTGWSYPHGKENLESIIRDNMLYPVTVLPSVDRFVCEIFARHGLILVHDIFSLNAAALEKTLGIEGHKAKKIANEVAVLMNA